MSTTWATTQVNPSEPSQEVYWPLKCEFPFLQCFEYLRCPKLLKGSAKARDMSSQMWNVPFCPNCANSKQCPAAQHDNHWKVQVPGRHPIRSLWILPILLRPRSAPCSLRQLHRNRRLCLIHDLRASHERHSQQHLLPNQRRDLRPLPLLQRHRIGKPSHSIPTLRTIGDCPPVEHVREPNERICHR